MYCEKACPEDAIEADWTLIKKVTRGNLEKYVAMMPDDPLGYYLSSLDKMDKLEVQLILPGHRSPGSNHHKRIEELKDHHQSRLNEVIQALSNKELTAYEITSQIKWDLDYPSWNQYPPLQKYLAVDETVAHLRYLENSGQLQERISGSKILFSLAN